MSTHPVAVVPDVDNVAVVQDAVDQCGCPDFVPEHAALFFEALVGGQHGGDVFVPSVDELEEQHGVVLAHRQLANLIQFC